MQTRRLELIGLEERITPVITPSFLGTAVVITTSAAESLNITVAADGSITNDTPFVAAQAGFTYSNGGLTIAVTAGAGTVTGLNLVGDTAFGDQVFAISGINSAAYNANFGVDVNMDVGAATDTLNINGAVALKGSGALVNTNIDTIGIASAGVITAATGAVGISATTISTAGNVTTTSGAITYTGAVTLTGNVTTTSTLASGNLSIVGALALAGFNFTANQGLGNITTISGGVSGIGNLTLTGAVVATGAGAIAITGNGELNATATTGDLTFAAGVSAPTVKATSLLGNVVFSSTVASTVGRVEVSAVTPTKAISIANTVTGANNSNITLTGDVLSNNGTLAQLTSNGNGAISIVGKVAAATAGNDFRISGAGAVSISGVVDSTIGNFTVDGTGTLSLGNNITTQGTTGISLSIAKTILTADVALKTTGVGSDIVISGTVDGAKKLTLETPAVSGSNIILTSVGQTTALNTVTVTTSGGVQTELFTATNVVLTDTVGTIAFGINGANPATTIDNLITSDGLYEIRISSGTTTVTNFASFINKGVQGNDALSIGAGATLILTNGGSITGSDLQVNNGTLISGGPLNVTAPVILNNAVINLALGTSSEFRDTVLIATLLTLEGSGSLTLSKVVNQTCTINLNAGTLRINDNLSLGTFTVSGGTLGGTGTLGNVTFNSGTLAPGNSPGTLTTGSIALSPQTTFAVEIGTTSTASDLLFSSGFITLSSANLSVTSVASGVKIGDSFTIVSTFDTLGTINGTFAGLPDGATLTGLDTLGNTVTFMISYPSNQLVRLKVVALVPAPQDAVFTNGTVVATDALKKFTAVGTDAGGGPLVTITFATGRKIQFFAYATTFLGGVRVALGNVDGGTDTELVTGPGAGGGPQVNVWKVNVFTGIVTLQSSFFAFSEPSFTGGVYVAAGDTNGDAFDDVIIGAGAGGGPRVQVYAGSATGVVTSAPLNDFFAYDSAFTGGVVVAAGDRNGGGEDEVITAPASNGAYHIKSFDCNGMGNSPTLVDSFFAFNDFTSIGGLSLAAGFLNSGNISDLIIGTTNGGYGVIIDFATAGITTVPFAGFTGAIRAGVAENAIGQDFAVALAGPRGGPILNTYSVISNNLVLNDSLFILDPAFQGGLFGTPTL